MRSKELSGKVRDSEEHWKLAFFLYELDRTTPVSAKTWPYESLVAREYFYDKAVELKHRIGVNGVFS